MKTLRLTVIVLLCFFLTNTTIFAQTFPSDNVTLDGRWAYGPSYGVTVVNADIGAGATDYGLMGNGGYLVLYDISTPGAPAQLATVGLLQPLRAIAVEVFDNDAPADDILYAYVADYEGGLRIVKIEYSAGNYTMTEVGAYDTGGQALDVDIGWLGNLNHVDFYDSNYGWIVGDGGRVLRTTDGGGTWNPKSSGTTEHLNSTHFVSMYYGWAVGAIDAVSGDGTIITTTNGGDTWSAQSSGITEDLNGVHFVNSYTGWAVGDNAAILRTSDGGITWNAQTPPGGVTDDLYSVHFYDSQTGWAVGDNATVINTGDGGTTWTSQGTGAFTDHLSDVYFSGNSDGWAVGDVAGIINTADGGATPWATQAAPGAIGVSRLRSVHFIDANNGWAVGDNGSVIVTANGGGLWTAQTSGTTQRFNSVYFTDANNGWAVGQNGTFLNTADGGTNWSYYTGTYVYVADGAVPGAGDGHVVVIDAIDKTAPRKIGEHYTDGLARAIAYSSNHVYVGYTDNSVPPDPPQPTDNAVRALDVTNPQDIVQADIFITVTSPRDLVLDTGNDYLFLADNTAFQTIDATDLSDPTFAAGGSLTTGFVNARGVVFDGANTVYAADEGNGLHKIDVTTLTAPAADAANPVAADGNPWNLGYDGTNTYLYATLGETGFQNFDLGVAWGPGAADFSDVPAGWVVGGGAPRPPTEGGHTRDVAVSGTAGFIADEDDGVHRIDIDQASGTFMEQTHINTLHFTAPTYDHAYGITVSGGRAYVASGIDGLKIFNANDLTLDGASAMIQTPGDARKVAVAGNYAYVADGPGQAGGGGIQVIDLDPTSPTYRTIVGSFTNFIAAGTSGNHNAWDVGVAGNRAYVAVQQKGLWIVDITTPTAPVYVDYVSMAGEVYGVAVDVLGRYAYLSDGLDGLRIVDVDPASANYKSIWTYQVAGAEARDAWVTGDYAYVAYGTAGFRIVNISTPSTPLQAGYMDTGHDAYAVALQGNKAYVADNEDGLYMFSNDLSMPTYFVSGGADASGDPWGNVLGNPTGRSIPVVIQTILMHGEDTIQPGDEIGIFDGDLLVGAAVYTGSDVTQITVWLYYEDPYTAVTLEGALDGNNMIFRVWNKSTGDELPGFPTYAPGSDGTFSDTRLLTVVALLETWQLSHFPLDVDPTGQYQQILILDDISINGVPIVPGDEIGVFDGLTCVGAAEYASPVTIIVWLETHLPGAVRGNPITYQIWDESDPASSPYAARATYDDGTNDKTFGDDLLTVTKLEAFTSLTQTIMLRQNQLNLISFNINPVDDAHKNISAMLGTVSGLQVCQDDQGQYYIPGRTPVINQIGVVDLTDGYQVYYDHVAVQYAINDGFILTPGTLDFTSTQFYMIGNPYQNPHYALDVFAALQSAGILVVLQDDDGKVWIPQYLINTIDDDNDADPTDDGLRPGKGYQIYVSQATAFPFPAEAGLRAVGKIIPPLAQAQVTPEQVETDPEHYTFKKTGLAYVVVITGSETPMLPGDEIGLFAGDLCVGAGVFAGEFPMAVPAWEAFRIDGTEIPGFKKGQPISLRVWSDAEGKEYDIPAVFKNQTGSSFGHGPMSVLSIGAFERSEAVPTTFELGRNYPNPFNPETMIPYQLPEASQMKLIVYNAMGQRIRTLIDEKKEAGWYTIKWDGCDEKGIPVSSGIYIVRMRAGRFVKNQKMMFIR